MSKHTSGLVPRPEYAIMAAWLPNTNARNVDGRARSTGVPAVSPAIGAELKNGGCGIQRKHEHKDACMNDECVMNGLMNTEPGVGAREARNVTQKCTGGACNG